VLRYLLGAAELAAIAAALAYGAVQARRVLLPGWSGAPARLVEAVLAVSTLLVIGELLGSVGLFREVPVVACAIAAGIGGGRIAAAREPGEGAPAPAPAVHPAATTIAIGAAFLVLLQWGAVVGFNLDHGMFQSDSTWHNGPFAARFWQTGWTTSLHQTDPLTFMPWFYPQNSELLNGVGLLLLHNDFLTLFTNVGWLLLAMLGAWCIGRPWGAGPASMVGALVMLDAANMLDSQAGEAKTDLMGIAFLLCAVGILVNTGDRTRWRNGLVLAGLSAGLALGTKFTMIPAIGVILVGLVVIAVRGSRARAALSFGLPMALTGGYWYVRNTVVSGTPLPQRQLDLGFLHLGAPQLPIDAYPQFSIAHYATDTGVWGTFFRPGLDTTFGSLWWLAIALAALGGVLALVNRETRVLQVAGAAVLISGLAYLVTPTTAGGIQGMPTAFVFNVRYAVPTLALGMALLPTARLARTAARRWALLGVLLLLLLVNDSPLGALSESHTADGLVISALLLLAPLALVGLRRHGASIGAVAAAGLAAIVLAVGLGRAQQTHYLDARYENAFPRRVRNAGLAAALHWAKTVHHARIGIVGGKASNREYVFFGDDLSNRVQYLGVPGKRGAFYPIRDCATWRRVINAGNYSYLVLSDRYVADSNPGSRYLVSNGSEAGWTRGDPNVRQIHDRERIRIFQLTGPLAVRGCPSASGGSPRRARGSPTAARAGARR
jgi:hypothetical protein